MVFTTLLLVLSLIVLSKQLIWGQNSSVQKWWVIIHSHYCTLQHIFFFWLAEMKPRRWGNGFLSMYFFHLVKYSSLHFILAIFKSVARCLVLLRVCTSHDITPCELYSTKSGVPGEFYFIFPIWVWEKGNIFTHLDWQTWNRALDLFLVVQPQEALLL